jgi:hypothetical protein
MNTADENGQVTFTVTDLTGEQAWQFAQFLKRVSLDDYKRLAGTDDEARDMMQAGEWIRAALSRAGYFPR